MFNKDLAQSNINWVQCKTVGKHINNTLAM